MANPRGFTLMETVVVIALTAVIFTVFTSTISAASLLKKSTHVIEASNFIREELDSLRTLPYTELTTRTNGNFLALSLTRGKWLVRTVSGAPSGTRVMALQSAQAALVTESGLAVFPGNYHADMDITTKINVGSGSTAGWAAGIAFHYRDAENHYRYRISSAGIALDVVYHGTSTTLWSSSTAHATDTWYTLEVVTSGSSITLKRNGSTLTTVTDSTFSLGDIAIMSINGALPAVDDVTLVESGVTTAYNFDSDTVGAMPVDWQRFVYMDLPSGSGTLTIANYNSLTGLRQCTATVSWSENGYTSTMTGTTLIAL